MSNDNQAMVANDQPLSPIDLTARALDKGLDADQLQKFMDLQERHEANEAKKAFNVAMAAVQSRIQPVLADAQNSQTGSRYAKLKTIVDNLAPIYTAQGFFVSFGTEECKSQKLIDDGWFRTTAELSHSHGHTKLYHVDLPADTRGPQGAVNKTVIHGMKSAITYARVILMGLMFNFTTTMDVDDDGNAAGDPDAAQPATDEQLASIQEWRDAGKITDATENWISKNPNMSKRQAQHLLDELKVRNPS